MKTMIVTGLLGLAGAAQAQPAVDWAAKARTDLGTMRQALRDGSPAFIVQRDSATYRDWIDRGYNESLSLLPKVTDARSYFFVLKRYANGFRDAHVQLWPRDELGMDPRDPLRWPGFAVGLRPDGYRVVLSRDPTAPPVGARLEGCDGHDVAAMVAVRDVWHGNMQLQSGRVRAAPLLLQDRGNPFVPVPVRCSVTTAEGSRSYDLAWRPITAADEKAVRAASLGIAERPLKAERWGARNWWLTVPTMDPRQPWDAFYRDVRANLGAIRAAPLVVVDLRGNGGGSSDYAERLARILWGGAMVRAHEPDLGPVTWRVSRANRDYWDGLTRDEALPADLKKFFASIRDRFDRALQAGRSTLVDPAERHVRPKRAPANPMRGRVVLLTDWACISACLDLMDLFTAMPGTVQAGSETNADTIFIELATIDKLPSGMTGFAYGQKAWTKRPRGSNQSYTPLPALTWVGVPDDEVGLRSWLEQVAQAPTR